MTSVDAAMRPRESPGPVNINRRRREFLQCAAAAALTPFSCASGSSTAGARSSTTAPATPFSSFDADLERLMGEHSLAKWNEYTHESPVAPGTLERLHADERRLFDSAQQTAQSLLGQSGVAALDRRRATLWRDGASGLALVGDPQTAELANRLESTVNAHIFEHEGRRFSRSDVQRLSRSDDPVERRAAYELSAGAHREVADIARAVIRRRALLGRERNAGSYGDAMLRLRGITPERWESLAAAFERGTRSRYQALVTSGATRLARPGVAPWDATYVLATDTAWTNARFPAANALEFARRALGSLGFDLDQPPVRVVVREFAFGGQTLALRVPTDVRTVIRPQDGQRFYRTLLHELGHGLQATRNRSTEAIFKGYEWVPGLSVPGFDEGMAEVFGGTLEHPDFLARNTGLDADERTRMVAGLGRDAIVYLRTTLAKVAFERAAMADPEQDLDALGRRVDREIRLLDVPDDAAPTWAATPFLATYPMYLQSYVLAAMVSAQVHAAIRERFGDRWIGPETGRFLTETLFSPGEAVPWEERIRSATGRELSADALVAKLTAD